MQADSPLDSTRRVLIVEDEEALLTPLVRYFERQGWSVVGAREREEAQAILEHHDFDLVVLDLALSGYGMDGLELLQAVREHGPLPPVLVLSGLVTDEIEAESRRRGADAVLAKPQPLSTVAELARRLTGDAA